MEPVQAALAPGETNRKYQGCHQEIPTIERRCGEADALQTYPAMLGGREESSEAFTVPWSFWQMAALTVQNVGVKMEAPHSGPNQT